MPRGMRTRISGPNFYCSGLSFTLLVAVLFQPMMSPAADLDEKCTVSIQNRTTRVQSDGTWVVTNAPANVGQVRARATCLKDGVTQSGQSDFFVVPADDAITLEPIRLGETEPIPESLRVSPASVDLDTIGETVQLTVVATLPDQSNVFVSDTADGTSYLSSSPSIATVSSDGLLTATGSGRALVSVTNEGALAVLSVRVSLSGVDSDLDGIPDGVELANGLNPNDPIDGLEDRDGDGLTNKQELIDFGTAIDDPDSDGDTISDGEEVASGDDGFVTNPLLPDTDGDGVRDGLEVSSGSDPTDPASLNLAAVLTAIRVTPDRFLLTFNTLIGEASQQLSVTGDLLDGTTINLTPTSIGTNYLSSDLLVCNFGGGAGLVFAGSEGLCTIDVSNSGFAAEAVGLVRTFAPKARGFVAIPGFANNVATVGDLAYVAAGSSGLQVVDVSDRKNPAIVGAIDTPGNANNVAIDGALAYVADGNGGLQIIDIADFLTLAIVGSYATSNVAWDVVLDGSLALVADGSSGLQIVDVSVPSAPALVGTVDTVGVAKGVDVDRSRRLAVVADGASGLQIVDYATASTPTVIGTFPTGGDARDVSVEGTWAFVADYGSSFTSVDLAVPSAPVLGASTAQETGGLLQDVAVRGDFGFGADVFFFNGIPVIDVSSPASPTPRTIIDFTAFGDDNGTGIAADANYVYLTASSTTGTENGGSGDTRLYIGEYIARGDAEGVPPTASIVAPVEGATLFEGQSFTVLVSASDDVEPAAVVFILGGDVVGFDLAPPYDFITKVPDGVSSLEIGAYAIDAGGNVGDATAVSITVAPPPLSTITGVVHDDAMTPAAGATVVCNGFIGTTLGDGTFSIGIDALEASVTCIATIPGAGNSLVGSSVPLAPVIDGTTDVGIIDADQVGPELVEPGWVIAGLSIISRPTGGHYNPIDDRWYVAQRTSSGGLIRVEKDGTTTQVRGITNPAAVLIDHKDGDIFVSEDFPGVIRRNAVDDPTPETWVSGFASGDDDPVGMAFAPDDYEGTVLLPGDALVVDHGANGTPDGMFVFSLDLPQGDVPVLGNSSALSDAVDVAIGRSLIFVADRGSGGVIRRVDPGYSLSTIAASAAFSDPLGIAIDPGTEDLFVIDRVNGSLSRVDPHTDSVSTIAVGFVGLGWTGVDVTPDGERLGISDQLDDTFYILQKVAP